MSAFTAIIFVVLTSLFGGEITPSGPNPSSSEEERVTEPSDITISESDQLPTPLALHVMPEGNAE